MSDAGEIDFNEVQVGINEVITLLSQIENNLGIDMLSRIDLNDLFETDFEEIKEGAKYFQALVAAQEAIKTLDLEFESQESKLAESNPEIRTLIDKKMHW